MSYETITLKVSESGVASLRLERPEKHNALSATMIEELTAVARQISISEEIRVVVLEAAGKSFCAGGDLAWMKQQMSASRDQRVTEARKLANMLFALNTLRVPLIAKVHGNAFGGGVGLLSVCDLVFCSKNIKFALTEVKLGLIPATISPYVLARIGESNARQVGLSAKIFDETRANQFGLVSEISDDLDAVVQVEAERFLKVAPNAVAASKALFRSLGPKIDADVINDTIEQLADTWEQAEASEGVSAFFDKRNPNWIV